MELRTELTDAQKEVEPRNADSHLTFIGAGLRNCVTYDARPDAPVYFIDLDGAYKATRRTRTTAVVGLRPGARRAADVGAHSGVEAPDRLGQPVRSARRADRAGQRAAGDRRASSAPASISRSSRASGNVGLTVNEYETLLMQNDLVDVLKNPLRFAQDEGAERCSTIRARFPARR